MSSKSRAVLTVIVLTLVVTARTASAQADKGSIQGRVTDSSNAVLQGASVTVGHIRAVTNTEASAIVGLPPGSYR
jgi:hypothetical protein